MHARQIFVGHWLAIVFVCWTSATVAATEQTGSITAVGSIGFTVSDMDRSVAFYRDVLAFKPISDVEVDGPEYDRLWGLFGVRARVVRMQLGAQSLELIEFLSPPDVRPIPVPSYSNDLWFQHIAIVVRDMEAAWEHLRTHHVRQISPRPQTIPISNPAAGGIKAIKFRDPDGHNLELLWFPDGKGNPVWHRSLSPAHPGGAETPPVPSSPAHPGGAETPPVPSSPAHPGGAGRPCRSPATGGAESSFTSLLFLGIDHTAMTIRRPRTASNSTAMCWA